MTRDLQPPGRTTDVVAERVLVIAPHFDDEILGCGGLLCHLSDRGARVVVVFLSDGAAGLEEGEDAGAYARRRAREAAEVGLGLGVARIDCLDLPDGRLDRSLADLRAALRERLEEEEPDLILVPSPLELTRDHRAAFAALHGVLGELRTGDALYDRLATVRVLAYEVNHPFYPDLLVDVGATVERLSAAMELYASQQERHDYLHAGLGLRRYRTHTLPPEITHAEGYCALGLDDFRTRSASQLERWLGGSGEVPEVRDGPLVSMVVRTRDRPELLVEALESLAQGAYRHVEVVLVNDGGRSPEEPPDFPFPIRKIDWPTSRGRSAAAEAGVELAAGDWIGFLDDDDLAAPEHLAVLADAAVGADVGVVYSDAAVGVYELREAGWECVERRLPYSRDFDREILLLDNYIPFNTLLIRRDLLERLRADDGACFDPELPFLEDWEMLLRLSAHVFFHHLPRVTCEYRHFRHAGHGVLGGGAQEDPDFERRFLEVKARVLSKHAARLAPEVLARAVGRLRAEAVALGEALGSTRRELARVRLGQARLEDDHRQLAQGHRELETEVERLYSEERALRQALEEQGASLAEQFRIIDEQQRVVEEQQRAFREQGDHLGRTYAEIERLNGQIEAMESTRAWRWHRRLERLKKGEG